ncbi:hypothetical protein FHT44_004979 [Mycolicibacterium sp. BK634]|uniref:hypothetical protein n=1 Tax=Mycolicibacterium sp. BK634 TaxID=2587099 RepID=UPI00160DC707|nr:hypothetical protein [Mycolicibacterium sp. BK634]MBB3752467.1 hypothetical protein [Mycolicibacterium sp. BK634]
MTCIVGVEHKHGVLIGADSCGSAGTSMTIRADEKAFVNGPYIMGYTTSYRMGQLLRYKLDPPIPTAQDLRDLDRFIATTFIDAVRTTLNEGGFAKIEDQREEAGNFLVGIAGRLYNIDEDYQFARNMAGFDSVGCGYELALGSLHTTARYRITPKERVRMALEAAAAFSSGVAPPFIFFDQAK